APADHTRLLSFPTRRSSDLKLPPDLSGFVLSPMPGLLREVAVAEGQEVKSGEKVAVIEAMKMENVLRAERDGRVKRIHAQAGARSEEHTSELQSRENLVCRL